jgi:hypothetical protein
MKEQDQLRALAEIDGYVWYRAPWNRHYGDRDYRFLALPAVQEYEGQVPEWKQRADGTEKIVESAAWLKAQGAELPKYTLDDLHRLEEALTPEQWENYLNELRGEYTTRLGNERALVHASVEDKRRAMLKAHGKWVDEPAQK